MYGYIYFSIVAAPIYILTNSARGFPFLHILANTVISFIFENSHSNRYEVVSRISDLQFPDVEHLFMYLFGHL